MNEALAPGRVTTLADGIRRLVAPNPGLMTGPGTNTYLLGINAVAVIDPGPAIGRHIDAILRAAGAGAIRWILATHTHSDHSPAVAELKERTDAEVWGLPAPPGVHQDASFAPERRPGDGDRLTTDEFELTALKTPGHASNHLCFLLRESGWLFTGDHVINGSTVVIDPPDGSMSAYLASLERLAMLEPAFIAGGHGEVIDQPVTAIEALLAHRMTREAKVRDALDASRGQTLAELVTVVYQEIHPGLHRLAERSLLAHLIKLKEDGEAAEDAGRWVAR